MIRWFLLLSIGASLHASSDYVPFSKFSQSQQIKYNFKKVEVNNIQKKEEVKKIENYYNQTPSNTIKEIEIVKPIDERVQEVETINVIQKEQLLEIEKIEQATEKEIVKQEVVQKTRYKQDILYSARLTYSPLSADYSDSLTSDSNKSNLIEPSGSVSIDNHKIEASYFKSDNDFFNNENLDTSWYKLGYKYNYQNVNVGLAANHINFDGNLLNGHDTFPSLEIDFKNTFASMDFEYGGAVGVGDQVEYSYEYFFNVNIKPSVNSDESFVFGYKNRTLELKVDADNNAIDHKLEFTGPFIGINTAF